MRSVAGAIEEGAKAYLRRQVATIGVIAGAITLLLWFWKGSWETPVGFLIGVVCSLVAGYIGMRVALMANVRTTHAAVGSRDKALNRAFSGGAVTAPSSWG